MRMLVVSLALALTTAACNGGYVSAPPQTVLLQSDASRAYRDLRSSHGPTRFAQVDERLYRGGQPSPSQVKLLHALGVRTIVSLKGEDSAGQAEEAAAKALGMKFVRVAFSAFSQPEGNFVRKVVDEVKAAPAGAVYVHCAAGRDRTSLIVALYRVWVNNWNAKTAWEKEALDYGHGGFFFRGMGAAYRLLTADSGRLSQR
jgi:protein tyrosine/serine phosphatase